VTTTSGRKSKLREALKSDYVKTVVLIIIIILGMFSFQFAMKAVLRTEYPFMTVVSGSMVPTLNVGDLVVVQGYADPSSVYAAPYPDGDIIVFWHWDASLGNSYLVHRAVDEKIDPVTGKRYFVTLGDANHGAIDHHFNLTTPHATLPGLPPEYVVGKVVANVPVLGQVLLFMQTPSVRIIVIVLVVALLIMEFIPFPKKKKKNEQQCVPEQEQVKA